VHAWTLILTDESDPHCGMIPGGDETEQGPRAERVRTAARILVMREYKTGRSVAGPVYLGEDPLRLAHCHACGSLVTPHTVTRHNLRGRATDQLDVGHFGATYLAARPVEYTKRALFHGASL